MALMHTPEPEIGSPCPDFQLPGTDGRVHSLADACAAKAVLVMFICNHCPYVIAVEDRLIVLGRELQNSGLKIFAICANDSERYPEDSFAKMKIRSQEKNYPFPYLHDESQAVARAFGAVCTPDFFLFDRDLKLSYRGRLDDSWKDASAVRNQELKAAITEVLAGRSAPLEQKSSMGCSIKWKPETLKAK